MTAKYPGTPIIILTHMVTIYIIVHDIIAGLIETSFYLRWGPLSFKLKYPQIIKDLFYNLIIFYKGDYFHLFPASGTNKWINLIYLLYLPSAVAAIFPSDRTIFPAPTLNILLRFLFAVGFHPIDCKIYKIPLAEKLRLCLSDI